MSDSSAPVVVGSDGSPSARAAVARAIDLAADRGAPLHLVRAYATTQPVAHAFGGVGPVVDVTAREDAERCLRQHEKEARARGVRCETFAVEGTAADALIGVAEAHAAGCIVVGSRGMHGPRRVLGSVPNAVSHRAGCDVLIVRTD